MRKELLSTAGGAVEAAKRAGAKDAWAAVSRSREVSYELRNGKLEKVQDSTSRGLMIRLFVDGRYSAHATTDLRPDQLRLFVENGVAITRAMQPDPHRRLADRALYPTVLPALQLDDGKVGKLERDTRLAWLNAMNERVAGAPKVISATSSVDDTTSVVAAASSNGFQHAYETTNIGYSTSITLDDGDKRPEDWMGAWARHVDALPPVAGIADEALRLTRARLGMTKGPTLRTTMIVDARAAGSLIGRLLGPASAASVQQERSFWRGKLGKAMVSSKLSVVDDPLIPRALGSRPFDGEGIAAARLPLIEGGVFKSLYVDTYYGQKLGVKPTTGGGSNRVVALGTRNRDALVAAAKDGVYVTSWLGGNMDPTTGDFSLGARGHLIEGGAIGAAIGEMNVTGNIVDLFGRLVELGNDPWKFSSTLAPTLVFEGVQFSGK
ncbi:MAG: TldD/PmbA family protein [Deltaproteobacteria bacterium]|nr:TldD/PmbA family protein [Deltaproteobacteria bacterium]